MITLTLGGHAGALHIQAWEHPDPTYVAIIAHGYGEHIGRYDHVAAALGEHGAAVYGLDHVGHGRSDGERALITNFDPVVEDLHLVVEHACADHPDRPVVLIGHSMGGLIATRYAERHGEALTALVLSAPLIGNPGTAVLLAMEPLPEIPIDPTVLSRVESVQQSYMTDPLVYHGGFKRPTLAAMAAALLDAALDSAQLTLPVLWQHGQADQLVPLEGSRRLVALLGNAEVTELHYPDARHEIFNEINRDEVLGDTTRFIADAIGAHVPAEGGPAQSSLT
jgi:alpha-beta hydrolase superfamily lysophospholipase